MSDLVVTVTEKETKGVVIPLYLFEGRKAREAEQGWSVYAVHYVGLRDDDHVMAVFNFQRFVTKRDGVLVAINGQPVSEDAA